MDFTKVGLVVAGAAIVAACSTTVDGTPQAGPDTSPLTTTESPDLSTTRTTPPGAPTVPTVPTRTATPGAPIEDTTCDEYIDLDEDAQRRVIVAVGKENELVTLNPELWITLTSALCTFAEPSTPVRDVLEGQGIR